MFTVSGLVRIYQVVRCKMIRQTRFNDMFYYFWYKREVGNWAVVREFIFVKGRFLEDRWYDRFFQFLSGAQFPQQASVWYSIEGLGKIQNGHINQYMLGICLSRLNRRSWTVTSSCVSHECNFLKPCWYADKILLWSRCCLMWEVMICSKILQQTHC